MELFDLLPIELLEKIINPAYYDKPIDYLVCRKWLSNANSLFSRDKSNHKNKFIECLDEIKNIRYYITHYTYSTNFTTTRVHREKIAQYDYDHNSCLYLRGLRINTIYCQLIDKITCVLKPDGTKDYFSNLSKFTKMFDFNHTAFYDGLSDDIRSNIYSLHIPPLYISMRAGMKTISNTDDKYGFSYMVV